MFEHKKKLRANFHCRDTADSLNRGSKGLESGRLEGQLQSHR